MSSMLLDGLALRARWWIPAVGRAGLQASRGGRLHRNTRGLVPYSVADVRFVVPYTFGSGRMDVRSRQWRPTRCLTVAGAFLRWGFADRVVKVLAVWRLKLK